MSKHTKELAIRDIQERMCLSREKAEKFYNRIHMDLEILSIDNQEWQQYEPSLVFGTFEEAMDEFQIIHDGISMDEWMEKIYILEDNGFEKDQIQSILKYNQFELEEEMKERQEDAKKEI